MKPIVAQVMGRYDFYRTLLRRALEVPSQETMAQWLYDLESTLADKTAGSAEKLEANATLVGLLSVMLDAIDAEQGKGEQP